MTLQFTHPNITEQEREVIEILKNFLDYFNYNEKQLQSLLTEYSRKETRIAELEAEIARMKEAEGKLLEIKAEWLKMIGPD